MNYWIRNRLIPVPDSHRLPILATLKMYEEGKDITNSPLIQSRVNLTHADVYSAEDKENALQARQDALVVLYENIKADGYLDGYLRTPILCWFDDNGQIHLYDGYHRLVIMEHLGLDQKVLTQTEWKGIDGREGRDFPIADILSREPPGPNMTYQPVSHHSIGNWAIERTDCLQRLEEILKRLEGKTVLDIGCAEGYFSRELAKRGYTVVAIDSNPNLVAAARYLAILEGVEVDYRTGDWKDIVVQGSAMCDNILLLSVLHNEMKQLGVEAVLGKLKALKGKTKRLFLEVPNNTNERQWMRDGFPRFDFHKELPKLEGILGLKVVDKFHTMRTTYIFGQGKQFAPWWDLESWLIPERTHYRPLLNTLMTKPCWNIMEIGTHAGDTAVVMIKAAAKVVPEKEIHYYGFDLFEESTPELNKEEFGMSKLPPALVDVQAHIRKHTKGKVTLLRGNTRQTLKDAVKVLPKMDLIYIDGGHSVETTKNDWRYASRLMGKNTIVYFDDYCDEMPFIGAKCILDGLAPKYSAQVMPEVNYYPRAFGRLKSQLLKVELKKPVAKTAKPSGRLRIHLLGLAHSKTTKEWVMCPFTQLTYKMAQMLTAMGHEVIHYGTEGSNPPGAEQVDVLTEELQKQAYGDWKPEEQLWIHRGNDPAYTAFRQNAIREIALRREPHDLLLISVGNWQKEIADAFPDMPAIEFCVGYLGIFSKYKVFPSYAWMHYLYGVQAKSIQWNLSNGNWYDAVIPHYFDPTDFEFCEKKDDYYLYVGRLIARKGPHVAVQITERLGAKLIVAGQSAHPSGPERDADLKSFGMDKPHVEYVGTVDRKERNRLMGHARALIVPSLYMEPFGKVVVESLLCGTPVITTDWGSFPEIVHQGEVGYRCRTMDDFLWAAKNIDRLDPKRCRQYAEANYSMVRISKMYAEYFGKVMDLWGEGWYATHPDRQDLNWLVRY